MGCSKLSGTNANLSRSRAMTDGQARGIVLTRLYELRDQGYVNLSRLADLGFDRDAAARYLQQLNDLNLITAKFMKSGRHNGVADAMAQINVHGVDAIENPDHRPSQVVIDQSINVHGSQNVQVGNSNQQTISIDIGKLNAAIDGSTATLEEKADAKGLLKSVSENKLLLSILAWAFSGSAAS